MFNTVPETNSNPIFSSYNVRSRDFNENMDEFVKAPNDIYIEEQKKKSKIEAANKNINADALNNIPDMPDFLKEEYEQVYGEPEWLKKLNVASPDEIEEWKNKGGMGIAEAWERNNKWATFAPYVNTTKDAADAITVSVLLDRAKKGEELSYEQQEKLTDYLRDIKELQTRGFTFGGGTVNAILTSIPYLEEFGIGLLTSEGGVGLASLGKTLTGIGAKRAARKAVETALKEAAIKSAAPAAAKKTVSLSAAKKIYKDTLAKTTGAKALANITAKEAVKETAKALPSAVASTTKFWSTKMPEVFLGSIADHQIATGVYVTDYGDAVFTSSEHLATSIMKAFGESTFETLTETAGWSFSPVANYFAKPIQKIMPKKFFTGFEKLVSSRYGMPAAEVLRKYGYDGVIEEMGEELLNRFLCQTFGLNGLDEYNFDSFMNNVFYANDPSQWGQEALSFAAVSGAGHVAAGSSSRISDEWNKRQTERNIKILTDRANRYIQSPEQFYLEQGLIKIKGSQSLAEQKLRDIWTSQNIDEGTQNEILKNMSETEIRSELKRNIEEGTQNEIPEVAAERIEKDLTKKFMDNKTFAKEKDAKSVAALFSAPLQKLSEVTGLSLEEIMEEEMPTIQKEAEEAAKENGRYVHTDGRIEEIFEELNSLPDDFNDEQYLTQLMDEVDILSKIRDGVLTEEDFEKARTFIENLDKAEYTELANELKELSYNQIGQYFQTRNNIEDNFDGNVEDITESLKQDVINILNENNLSEDEFNIEDVRIYGSYSKGTNKATSDLDFVVLYSGTIREDDAFNILNDEKLTLTDKTGKEVEVDINPINNTDWGSIDEYLSNLETLEPKALFQSVSSAGAEGRDISAAKKEWEEKGTESKYFKKFADGTKILSDKEAESYNFTDKEGVTIESYHGGTGVFSIFDKAKTGASNSNTSHIGFWFSPMKEFADDFASENSYGDRIATTYHCYIKMKNPKVYKKFDNSKELKEITKRINELEEKINSANNFQYLTKNEFYQATKKVQYTGKEFREKYQGFLEQTLKKEYALNDKEVSELIKIADSLKEYNGELKELRRQENILQDNDPYLQLRDDMDDFSIYGSGLPDFRRGNNRENYGINNGREAAQNFVDSLKAQGYDGIIIQGTRYDTNEEHPNNQFVVFDSNQIKSVDNQGTFDEENPNIYYQNATTNYQEQFENVKANLNYKQFVNKVFDNKLSKQEKSKPFRIGKTPDKLIQAGFPDNNISIGYKIIEKAQDNRNPDHNLSKETISKVYQALDNPIAVIKAEQNKNEKTPNNRYSVVVDLKDDAGKYVLVAFEINKKDGNILLNDIRSIHSRKDYTPLIDKAFNENRLIKIDRDKIKDLLTPKIQPDIISSGVASLIENIYQQTNNVKFFQSAYHGTPHKFEKFSTKKIGTGEGAQAHGWGLYFAEDKNVSEGYRKALTNDYVKPVIPVETFYDGEEITYADLALALEDVNNRGKEKAIKDLNDELLSLKEELYELESNSDEHQETEFKIKDLEEIIDFIKEVDVSKLKVAKRDKEGQLFEVDIPENDVLLDEDKPFSQQSEKVKKTFSELFKNEFDIDINNPKQINKDIETTRNKLYEIQDKIKELTRADKIANDKKIYNLKLQYEKFDNKHTLLYKIKNNQNSIFFDGKQIYKTLSDILNSNKEASLLLNKYGIKGITYDGHQDGRCYVVFDDKAVNVLKKYYQGADDAIQGNMFYDNITPRRLRNMNIKGAFVPAENLIELFKNADESTIIHEFAHWWLSRLEKYAQNNEELAQDLEEVRKFVKNNGEKFTREQHEKFAVGFEAYIRNGSARSNRLKRIFEDFKNALIQIYDSIRQLVYTEGGEQYSFTEEDVKNLENLFERLLTTENERIRKTVFDRCDDINDKIKEIKSRQEQEMKELDEIWKDNIAINNRKSDKKRKVQEYLDMAETSVRRVPKEVKEMKKRYKDATLDILSIATGMDKRAIANPRNWEKVQMALEHADDRITVQGGMHAEWEEFYSDTGVNYDTDEVGGDYELAEKAFNVLVDGNYNFANMNEDEIGEFYGKFEYLYSKVQTLKGEEKSNALQALWSLFENMPSMPDEVVEDIVQRLSKISDEYEESQKEDFNRKSYPNIPVVQQLQYYVTHKLSDLKVYDPNVRYKVRISKSHSLYKAIKNATSVNSTKRIIRKINEYVIADLENQAKAILHKEIQKQVRVNSKLVKVGTISKGKFDWKTNTVFAELAELNKLKQNEAFKEYAAMIELDKAAAGEERENNDENVIPTPEFKTDFQSNLRRKFLEYRSSKLKDLNLLATRSLLEDIMTLKFEGRRAKDAEELEKRLQKDDMKTDLAQRVREIKDNNAAKAVAKFIMGETPITSEKTLVNWETALNTLFGRDVAQRYSLLKLESDAEVYAYKHYSDFCQKAIELYGLNNPVNAKEKFLDKFNRFVDFGNVQPLIKLMQEYEEEVYNFAETTFSKETGQFIKTPCQLSRAEIITLYAWSMNEELEQRIMTQYGFSQVRYMFDEILSDEDKQFAWLLIDTCEEMYDENNEVFIRTTGLSLPKVENYFPSKTVRVGSEIDMLHENVVRSSNPSFIKQRKVCNRIKMKPEQPISILLPHINKTARYVILSERLNYLNAIFKDSTVRAAIKEVFDGVSMPFANVGERVKGKVNKQKRTVGDRIHDTLINQLGSSTFENFVRGLNVGKSWADALATNYITSRIGGNLKVAFGQLTSVINYAEKMPAGLWGKGFAEGLKTPKETFKYMLDNCDYLKARLAGNSMNEIMSRITDESDRFRTLRNFCSTNTKYGDILAICFGGKPYVDFLIKQGMTKEEAFEKFVEDTLRAQQSGHNSATSVWQKKMSENFFTRMMFAFNNTSLQYERKFLDAVAQRARGETTNKEFIKALIIYKVFNPILFTSFLGNLSIMQLIGSLIRGDGDDDTLSRFGIDAGSAMVFANMGAYGFAGMGIKTVCQFLMATLDKKEYKPFLSSVPIISDIEGIGKDLILKNEVTVADWVDAMAVVGDDATGVPVSRITNAAGGIGDIAQGEVGVGTLRLLGWGNYRSHLAATGEPPKKNKKK